MLWLLGNRAEAAPCLLVTHLLRLSRWGGRSDEERRPARRSGGFVRVQAGKHPLCPPSGRDLHLPSIDSCLFQETRLSPASHSRNWSLEQLQEIPCGEGTWYILYIEFLHMWRPTLELEKTSPWGAAITFTFLLFLKEGSTMVTM